MKTKKEMLCGESIEKKYPKDEQIHNESDYTVEILPLCRWEKGFYFELFIQELLDNNKIGFVGNSTILNLWCKETKKGHDIELSDGLRIECKFVMKPVAPSWFKRDWLPRAADIFVTNDRDLVEPKLQCLLNKPIVNPDELVDYILSNGNKSLNNIMYSKETIGQIQTDDFKFVLFLIYLDSTLKGDDSFCQAN